MLDDQEPSGCQKDKDVTNQIKTRYRPRRKSEVSMSSEIDPRIKSLKSVLAGKKGGFMKPFKPPKQRPSSELKSQDT